MVQSTLFSLLIPALLIKLCILWGMGLYRGWWHTTASFSDIITVFKGTILSSSGFIVFVALYHRMEAIPRSVLLLDAFFFFVLLSLGRIYRRTMREHLLPLLNRDVKGKRLLIIGAGNAGEMLAREIRQNTGKIDAFLVGFLDDDIHKQGISIQGYPVLGTRSNLETICLKKRVEEIIIAVPSATGQIMKSIVEDCQKTGLPFKTLPGISELIDGTVSIQQIKNVDVEDLLGRQPVKLDMEKIEGYLRGKRVLITGAAGSIGSEICRQVARFAPAEIVLFDIAETPLFYIHNELIAKFSDLTLSAVIGDIRAKDRVQRIFERYRPEVVFHAAAYKHVPMMEANPAEAVKTNALGTRNLADIAHQSGVSHFVMISTDKAVRPTSVMGATKRLAEIYVQHLSRSSHTRFVTVRFGNVLESSGSVIPIFKEQIAQGGPVTVTHPDVTRFFMTIPEAAQLVLQAGGMGQGGEIFLLDMGESVRIVDLARELIRLSGFVPDEDIEIVFTGLRPGEKLYEELLLDEEGARETPHEKIMVVKATDVDMLTINHHLEDLYQACRNLEIEKILSVLRLIIPEYCPSRGGSVYNLHGSGGKIL